MLNTVEVHVHGPAAEHNMPCCVCGKKHAVLYLSRGTFQPCWSCQEQGWRTVRLPRWLARLIR